MPHISVCSQSDDASAAVTITAVRVDMVCLHDGASARAIARADASRRAHHLCNGSLGRAPHAVCRAGIQEGFEGRQQGPSIRGSSKRRGLVCHAVSGANGVQLLQRGAAPRSAGIQRASCVCSAYLSAEVEGDQADGRYGASVMRFAASSDHCAEGPFHTICKSAAGVAAGGRS